MEKQRILISKDQIDLIKSEAIDYAKSLKYFTYNEDNKGNTDYDHHNEEQYEIYMPNDEIPKEMDGSYFSKGFVQIITKNL